MVKLTLEYDPDYLDKCRITCNDITYDSEININYKYRKYFIKVLQYLENEMKYRIYSKFNSKTWYISVPIHAQNVIQTGISEMCDIPYSCVEIITIEKQKFYKLYTDLYIDYNKVFYEDIDTLFLCSKDLKFISNSEEIPNTRFNVKIDKIHVCYIPNLNQSFLIDSKSLTK